MGERETIPVPRNRVFVLEDGTFVVQWEENRVQDLLLGKYRPYSDEISGSPISDYELTQLKNKGIVDRYDEDLIHLCATPNIIGQFSPRAYYLNTALAKTEKAVIENRLAECDLLTRFSVRTQDRFVIIRGPNGMAFPGFEEAERARELLVQQDAALFGETVVAFVEIISAT